MPPQWTPQPALPVQSRQDPRSRPQSAHASMPADDGDGDEEAEMEDDHDQEQTPRSSVQAASTDYLLDGSSRRLSRDDTAANVSEPIPPTPRYAPTGPLAFDPRAPPYRRLNTWAEEGPSSRPSTQQQFRRAPRYPRRMEAQSLAPAEASSQAGHKINSLGRRVSRTYQMRMEEFKENVSRFSTTGRNRRASNPQQSSGLDASTRFIPSSIMPTSPSKRNGKHEGDRPFKQRHFLLQGERKDTPAPTSFASIRPASRNGPPSIVMGGERARKAAAASKAPAYLNESSANSFEMSESERPQHLGHCPSAADSGADLSYFPDTLQVRDGDRDSDGDVEMKASGPTDPLRFLPPEIALQILEYLDAKDLTKAELVCSSWKAAASKTSVWRNAFLRRWKRRTHTNPVSIQVGGIGCGRVGKPDQEWKRMYKARLNLEANWRKGAEVAGKATYLAGHTDSVYCLQFDEHKIITGSRDRTIRVWDINNYSCIRVIGGPNVRPVVGPKVLRTVDYPDFHLATASVNGTAYGNSIYQVPAQWHDASILCLQYDDKILVTGSSDSDLIVWDIESYEPIQRLRKHSGGVLDVALDAKHIVSCSKDSRIIVWDRETYQPKGELSGHRGPVNAVQLRGHRLVSASGDGIARLWDINQMKLIKEFSAKERGLAAVEFSEDGKYVLAGGNDTITYKFEVDTGREVQQFTGHSQLVRSLWLDSQNNRVVSGSYDLDLRVYDFETGEEIWRAEEWTTSWMLAAKSDYRRIVSTSQDGRILIVDFGLHKCISTEDGQPFDDVDLLRGSDWTSAVQWRDPWVLAQQQERERRSRSRSFLDAIAMISPRS